MQAAELLAQIETHRQVLRLPAGELSYLEWRQGQKPLLLLHGMVDHGIVWANLAERLQDRYHILAPDLRGHGNSCKPASGYRCPAMIADLEALISHVGWSSAHVLAHSWAAKVAAVWATQNPQVIRSLVLVDPFFMNSMPPWVKLTFPLLYRVLPFLKMLGPFETYEQAEQQARQLKQFDGWSPLQQAIFAAGIEEKPNGQWGSKFALQARDEIFEDMMQVSGLTKEIIIPTLFIQPKQGLNRTSLQLQPFQRYLKHLQIVQVPGHHWCFLVEPDSFNQAVASFLDAQENAHVLPS